jgi:RNA-binding protein
MGGNVLTGKEKRALRAEGNLLKPEVWIGKEGLTSGTITNIENTFNTKELVKIKIHEGCPLDKKEVGEIISDGTGAELVQTIGRTLLFYRPFPEEAE